MRPSFGEDTSGAERFWAVIAYVSTFFAPFLAPAVLWIVGRQYSKFVSFHAAQSLLLQLYLLAMPGVFGALATFFGASPLWILAPVFGLCALTTGLWIFFCQIVGGIAGFRGSWRMLPWVGRLARRFS